MIEYTVIFMNEYRQQRAFNEAQRRYENQLPESFYDDKSDEELENEELEKIDRAYESYIDSLDNGFDPKQL